MDEFEFRGQEARKKPPFQELSDLRQRETEGTITFGEMQSLLKAEFNQFLTDNPPIGKEFDPSLEVGQILRHPKAERRQALETFKNNLAKQREAWATCRTFIERLIMVNHDVPREILTKQIDTFAQPYGFTEEQKALAEQIIDAYCQMRKRVVEIRKRYPDNRKLVKRLTGISFSKNEVKDFEISVGPLSIDIICSSVNANRLHKGSKDVTERLPFTGFADYIPIGFHWIGVSVINRDSWIPNEVVVSKHELEHQKFKLFRKHFDRVIAKELVRPDQKALLNSGIGGFLRSATEKLGRKKQWEKELLKQYLKEGDSEAGRKALESYFKIKRARALVGVKDEIFAFMSEGEPSPDFDKKRVFQLPHPVLVGGEYVADFRRLFFRYDGSARDYLASVRDYEPTKDDPVYQKLVQKHLKKEYERIIRSAISAFLELENNKGYSRSQTIAFFADKPLQDWPKAAKRQMEYKK